MGDNGIVAREDVNNKFKITFDDGTSVYKIGANYTSSTVTTRQHISNIFDNKENQVTSIEIYAGCDIPFYTNNTNFSSAGDILVNSYYSTTGLLFSNLPNLTSITVEPDNTKLSSINGVLFSKDGTILYTYPPGKTGETYNIPSNVTRINCLSFMNTIHLKEPVIPNNSSTILWIAAFANATGITRVTIPNNINTLYPFAFASCKNLANFTASVNIKTYGPYAFYYCIGLTTLTLPNNPDGSLTIWFYDSCFRECRNLRSITLPNNTKFHEFGQMFWNCTSLLSITLPNSVTIIPKSTFYYCISLANVTFSNTLTEIHTAAFGVCKSLQSVSLPMSLTTIKDMAFSICTSLTTITIPSSIIEIGMGCFGTCINLQRVIFGQGIQLTTLSSSLFHRCIKLNEIIIPPTVKTIGSNCFSGTPALTTLVFPDSISSIDANAFSKATVLDYNSPVFAPVNPTQYYNAGLKTLYMSSTLLSNLSLKTGNNSSLYGVSDVNIILYR